MRITNDIDSIFESNKQTESSEDRLKGKIEESKKEPFWLKIIQTVLWSPPLTIFAWFVLSIIVGFVIYNLLNLFLSSIISALLVLAIILYPVLVVRGL